MAKIVLKAQERQGKKVREQKYDDSSSSVPSSREPGLNAKAFEVFREEFEAYKTHMNDGMDKMKKQFEEFKQSALVMSSTSQSDNSASVASLREILERHQTTMGTHEASLGNIRSEMEAFKRDHNAARETALTTIRSEVEMGCSVLGRGAEPPQFWVLLIWLEPGISHVTRVHYDATMCLPCIVCSILPVLHFLRFDLCVL